MINDRRIKYTKLALTDSLIELLLIKPISKISIKEICEKADINRGTFYTHYGSQYELLENIVSDYLLNISDYLAECRTANNLYDSVANIFEYIVKNEKLTKAIFSANSDIDIANKILNFVSNVYQNDPSLSNITNIKEKDEIFAFITSGVFGAIQCWLKSESRKTPKEMAKVITDLINNGVSSFIK